MGCTASAPVAPSQDEKRCVGEATRSQTHPKPIAAQSEPLSLPLAVSESPARSPQRFPDASPVVSPSKLRRVLSPTSFASVVAIDDFKGQQPSSRVLSALSHGMHEAQDAETAAFSISEENDKAPSKAPPQPPTGSMSLQHSDRQTLRVSFVSHVIIHTGMGGSFVACDASGSGESTDGFTFGLLELPCTTHPSAANVLSLPTSNASSLLAPSAPAPLSQDADLVVPLRCPQTYSSQLAKPRSANAASGNTTGFCAGSGNTTVFPILRVA